MYSMVQIIPNDETRIKFYNVMAMYTLLILNRDFVGSKREAEIAADINYEVPGR